MLPDLALSLWEGGGGKGEWDNVKMNFNLQKETGRKKKPHTNLILTQGTLNLYFIYQQQQQKLSTVMNYM